MLVRPGIEATRNVFSVEVPQIAADGRTAADRAAAGAGAQAHRWAFFFFRPFLSYILPFFYIHFVVLGCGSQRVASMHRS